MMHYKHSRSTEKDKNTREREGCKICKIYLQEIVTLQGLHLAQSKCSVSIIFDPY